MICRMDDPFEELAEVNEQALLADGFEAAYVGYTVGALRPSVAVYDYQACIEVLAGDGMTDEEAEEYMAFNTLGAYVGENGPLFVRFV